MTTITQTSQFAALKRVLWFLELERITEDSSYPIHSYEVLRKYVEEKEKEASIEFRKEKILSEIGKEQYCNHGDNVPAGYTGE